MMKKFYYVTWVMLLLPAFYAGSASAQFRLENAFPKLTFLQPLDLQSPRDGSNRLFVVTQKGIIYVFENDSSTTGKKVFLDISDEIVYGGEMGLLGLAFDPGFKDNGYFYVNYTAPSQLRTVIARYRVMTGDQDKADESTKTIILEVTQPYENHNAGQLAFGPDGYLYVGLGDGGSGGDPQNNAQNLSRLLGKMLRIDVHKSEGGMNYAIPADNPFSGNTNGYRAEIWASGLRNPWRYSFDPVTGWLWCGDVGQDKYEEIDIIQKGKNYGWRITEGYHCYNPSGNCDTSGLTSPVWEYAHDDQGGYSLTGGYVYRGSKFPELYEKYLFADFVSGRIWALTYNNSGSADVSLLISSRKAISSFGVDDRNEIYICSFDGNIYSLAYSDPTYVPGSTKPKEYGLYHNFPNPFNPKTTIIADIKEKGNVRIEIYSVSGEKIATLFSGILEAGRHRFTWDAENLPSGVYIYRMAAGNLDISKKMVLLK